MSLREFTDYFNVPVKVISMGETAFLFFELAGDVYYLKAEQEKAGPP